MMMECRKGERTRNIISRNITWLLEDSSAIDRKNRKRRVVDNDGVIPKTSAVSQNVDWRKDLKGLALKQSNTGFLYSATVIIA